MSLRRMGIGTAFVVAGAFVTSAQAAPVTGGVATKMLIDPAALVQKTQVIVFGGRRWCFYDDAWNGSGWYWCDYRWRRGYGWGGEPGWHGWRHNSRTWHQRNRGGERGRSERSERRRYDGDRGGRSSERGSRSDRSMFDGRRDGSRDGMSRGRSGGRSDGGRGASSGRGGGHDGGRGGRGGRG